VTTQAMSDDGDAIEEPTAVEYRNARLRMQELAASLDDHSAGRTVPACPDWSIRGLLSHVTGIAVDLSSGRRPENGDTQAWVDRQVAERRHRSIGEVVAEWDDAGPRFEAMIAARPDRLWGLTYDTVVHEHDLRGALGRTDARDTSGVRLAAQLGMRLVELDLAKHGLPAFRWIDDEGTELVVGDREPELTLRATAYQALRLLGSRRTEEQLRAADFDGDLDRYLPGIVHMDLPSGDLGE
jgi:uncharacterized protein (TIGR03083 family)